ncbi:hypothetical protein [Bradyrhizobium sp. McL0616]|uniref:hypothetical protein n=1 Tax=Bradyrhizobium sp. McL0616 TaxID=3415674 RepID=UPI003CF432A1
MAISRSSAIITTACLLLGFPTGNAQAVEAKNATYYCVVEMAGGLFYDENSKRWRSGTFRTDEKFVLKLKYLRTQVGKDLMNRDEAVQTFNVAIVEGGSNTDAECRARDWSEVVEVRPNNYIVCNAVLSDYIINLSNNRFLRNYMCGYVDGVESNKNTPAVSGGTCTKIN